MAGYGSLVLGNTVVNHVAEMQTAQSASWLHGRPQPGGVEGLYLAHAESCLNSRIRNVL